MHVIDWHTGVPLSTTPQNHPHRRSLPLPIPAGPGLTPRTLLRDDVHRRIRDAIVRGELQPGEIGRAHV